MGYVGYKSRDDDIITDRMYMHAPQEEKPEKKEIVFYTMTIMKQHIKETHKEVRPIIFVNGKVVSEEVYIEKVFDVVVWRYGFDTDIIINDSIRINNEEKSDITAVISDCLIDNKECKISVGKHDIYIRKFSVEFINNRKVINQIYKWQNEIQKGQTIVFDLPDTFNNAQRRYLQGFYNYFVACSAPLEAKKARYQESYSIIKNFSPLNALGLCVLKVVAFRFNWVENLKSYRIIENDEFDLISDFYDNSIITEKDLNLECIGALYVEDDISEYIKTVIALINKEYAVVNKYVSQYSDVNDISDLNHRERVLLIKARYEIQKNRPEKAKRCYKQMILPAFEKECKEYLNR